METGTTETTKARFWVYMGGSFVVGGIVAFLAITAAVMILAPKPHRQSMTSYRDPHVLYHQRVVALERFLSFIAKTSSEGVVNIGDITYSWQQKGDSAEFTRHPRLGQQAMVFVLEFEKENIRLGIKHSADRIEWVEEPPLVLLEDTKEVLKMFNGV